MANVLETAVVHVMTYDDHGQQFDLVKAFYRQIQAMRRDGTVALEKLRDMDELKHADSASLDVLIQAIKVAPYVVALRHRLQSQGSSEWECFLRVFLERFC